MAWSVPLADIQLRDDELAAVVDTYRSGWLSMGPRTEEFEAAFRDYCGVGNAIAVANGTAALHLSCMAVGLGADDEVVVPSLTFVATANAVAYTGARPVFADIAALDRPWLSAETVERAITPRTRAVMTMAYGGHPGEIEALRDLCAERGILLLEDAAHAIGAHVGGRQVGSFGAAGAFSFFSNKNLAVGEGGAVITDDDALAARARTLRSHGMTTMSWDRYQGHAASYDVVALGFNYRIDEPRAALGTARLARLDEENRRRAEIVDEYRRAFGDEPMLTLIEPPPEGAQSAHHLFSVVLDESIDRGAFRRHVADRGVQTSVHYPPAHRFSIYAADAPELPVSDAYGARTVTLPLFPHITDSQVELVVESVRSAVAAAGVVS